MTYTEYWLDYDIISNDVHTAMVSCYTHRAINHLAASDLEIRKRMNNNAEFWKITSYSLQNTLFIVLSRILDSDRDVYSVHKFLNATIAHPEFFSKAARSERKSRISGSSLDPNMKGDPDTWERRRTCAR